MLEHVTTATLKHISELARASKAAEWEADPDKSVLHTIDLFEEELLPTPEHIALEEFIQGESYDQLIEIQACYWLGLNHTAKDRVESALRGHLDHSRRYPEHMAWYILGKSWLDIALGRAASMIEEHPGLVRRPVRDHAVEHQ
jgi:hypothetical protein